MPAEPRPTSIYDDALSWIGRRINDLGNPSPSAMTGGQRSGPTPQYGAFGRQAPLIQAPPQEDLPAPRQMVPDFPANMTRDEFMGMLNANPDSPSPQATYNSLVPATTLTPAEANAPSPITTASLAASNTPRSGWWSGRPEFQAGPSVLDIWNGMEGRGHDAQGRITSPGPGIPTFPGLNEQLATDPFPDFQISNPGSAPIGTFTAGPIYNSPEVAQEMSQVPFAAGSAEYNQALRAANTRDAERTRQRNTTPQELAVQAAQGYTPIGGSPIQGSVANTAQLAAANAAHLNAQAASTPSGPQAAYIAGRRHLTEQLERANLNSQQIQAHLRANGYGPITLGGPELPDVTADVNASLTPLDRAITSLLPVNPQNGATIGTAPRAFDAASRPLYTTAITDLMTRTPDNELTNQFLDQARQRISPTAFQAWLDTPSWQLGGWMRDPIPLAIQQARVRAALARRTQVPGGPLITNGGPLR